MTAAMAKPGNTAATFLTHLFGRGLADDSYVVERFRSAANGEITLCGDGTGASAGRGRRKAGRVTATLEAVRAMRPAPNEIIVCTAVRARRSGVQYWGSISTALFCDRQQRG